MKCPVTKQFFSWTKDSSWIIFHARSGVPIQSIQDINTHSHIHTRNMYQKRKFKNSDKSAFIHKPASQVRAFTSHWYSWMGGHLLGLPSLPMTVVCVVWLAPRMNGNCRQNGSVCRRDTTRLTTTTTMDPEAQRLGDGTINHNLAITHGLGSSRAQ